VEAVFEHLRGVRSVVSGYASYGKARSANEAQVPIETVRIVYDPASVTLRQLLDVFFTVAHDPTTKDRQGPDVGPEYRGVVFYETDQDRQSSEAFRAELIQSQRFARPIVTEIQALGAFSIAEAFHQDYAARNPNEPYIVINDAPKIAHLKKQFPRLYQERRAP
jgi:peptide-methionine (S)-S-oxide reductase